jgi:hypothetical protein
MKKNFFEAVDRFAAQVIALVLVVGFGMSGVVVYQNSPVGLYAAKGAHAISIQVSDLASAVVGASSVSRGAGNIVRRPLLGSAYDQGYDPLREVLRVAASNPALFLQR